MRPESIAFRRDEFVEPAKAAVRLRWLGTAGFEMTSKEHTVLIDPYVTRAPFGACLLERLVPDEEAIARYVRRVDAVIVGHTHFDHVLDVPAIARRTGAMVFGSHSAARLCRAAGVRNEQIVDVERNAGAEPVVAEVGPFRMRFLRSAHSKMVMGRAPFGGDIRDGDAIPLRAERFRSGAVLRVDIEVGSRRVVHLGSAELVEEGEGGSRGADLLLLCAAGWKSSRDFPERVMRVIRPDAILLSHWDNFFLDMQQGARALPGLRIGALVERLEREGCRKVGTLPLLGELFL